MYVFDKYCPIIPIQKSWIPPIKVIMQASDGQPSTGSPHIAFLTTIKTIAIKETNVNSNPITDAICSGALEKLKIPSSEYLNNFQKFHFVSPAAL